jgi:hypothetical protein
VDLVEAGQIFILLRMLIGKLHEAWVLYKKRVQADQSVRTKLDAELSDLGKDALDKLNKHFGRSSLMTEIRNRISFHYDDKEELVEASFQKRDSSEPWDFYLSDMIGNSFYYASELVIAGSVIDLAASKIGCPPAGGLAREEAAFASLCHTTIKVSRHITVLFNELVPVLIGGAIDALEVEEIDIGTAPQMSAFALPFFFDEDDLRRQMKQ